jgi:hypothetical protein
LSWKVVGAIAEALGAVVVIATLRYLAVQIRANTAAIRAEARRTNVGQTVPSAAIIGATKEASSVLRHGLSELGALDSDERVQFIFLLTTIVSQAGSSFEEFKLGINDLASFESTSHQALQLFKTPGRRDFRATFVSTFPAGFKAHVDREPG